jgi:hypothetical protein
MEHTRSTRIWYVFSCNKHTKRFVSIELNRTDDKFGVNVEDVDSKYQKVSRTLDLASLNSDDEVKYLREKRVSQKLAFKIFVQDEPDEKIYRWPRDEGARPVSAKPESRRS